MKLVLKMSENCDGYERNRLECDGKEIASIHPLNECPEDAYIHRGLIGGRKIIKFMRMSYEAGKRGEEFTVEEMKDDEE